MKGKIGLSGSTPRKAAMVLSILKQKPCQDKILTTCYYCIFCVFSPKKQPYPVKIENYFIAILDFLMLNFKKAQFTRFNTACFEDRHFYKLT